MIVNYGSSMNNIMCTTGCKERIKHIPYNSSEQYMTMLRGDSVLVMNDLATVLRVDKQIHDILTEEGCCSYIQVLNNGNPQSPCIVTFYIFGVKHKWSDNERDFMEIIANTICSVLTRQEK